MANRFLLLILILSTGVYISSAQKFDLQRIDPPNWWVGMEHSSPQLLLYGESISNWTASIDHPGVRLVSSERVENPNYLFLNVAIGKNAKPGTVTIQFTQGKKKQTAAYELKPRDQSSDRIQGLGTGDFIYLVFPDRFANGDPSNDIVEDMNQTTIDRSDLYQRHGGDIQGIIDHLDYFRDLGVTALWLNPVLENNQPAHSYHGYAATDLYKIDPRFGTNELYKELAEQAQNQGIKIVMDIIHNHVGDQTWFIKDPPMPDWVHQWDEYTRTTYRAPTMLDPHASEYDRKIFNQGWFDTHMPDLNQDNPYLTKYLIQNNIWWIEYAGVDAFRMDTYAYSDPGFLEQWAEAILTEYPRFFMYGETWVHGVPIQAYYHGQTVIQKDFDSKLPSLTDFQLYYAINDALTKEQGWTDGVSKLYYTLAQDYLYSDPSRNIIFLDNHDLSRFYSVVGEDFNKYKMGIAWMMTVRGIPCMYYGTELLLSGFTDHHGGTVRQDFPGGWEGDTVNKFTTAGRTTLEQEAFDYVQTLANWRKDNPVLHAGKLMQFVPQDGVYVYFRYTDEAAVMVIMNTNESEVDVIGKRYWEMLGQYAGGRNVETGRIHHTLKNIQVPGYTTSVIELAKYPYPSDGGKE